MQKIAQPFINLSTANAALITSFAQSPEMVELANTSAQKYFELAQKTFGAAAASEGHADLVRSLMENYSTFAREHAESLMGLAAEGQAQMATQVKAATDRLAETTQAAAVAVADASKLVMPGRAK
ncbi:hypothetical protein [Variovorax guangxiensis]|uniref:hypothetical protein n=1 Tax=Variovorax guangxiensis TaxID=1775474 RepID=UPI00285F4ABD|nr:hypothetical protein [Variovorax guangxiensis]MDR6859517.1 hypothetical protein [Variovorax guangxiensis]